MSAIRQANLAAKQLELAESGQSAWYWITKGIIHPAELR
jgi:hypothetical protein